MLTKLGRPIQADCDGIQPISLAHATFIEDDRQRVFDSCRSKSTNLIKGDDTGGVGVR
jgi:hypothetical protein